MAYCNPVQDHARHSKLNVKGILFMEKSFWTSVMERRSFYSINKQVKISDERIKELIEKAVLHTPTAFNSQSGRVVLLLNEQHNKLWSITKESLRKIVPAENFADTEKKIDSFSSGYGTILFFEDNSIIERLQQQFPIYKDNFPIWSQQSNGILQFTIWTALCAEELGATLQHYNELIETEIKKEWQISQSWKLIAQMPFGNPTAAPDKKEYVPIADRVLIKG